MPKFAIFKFLYTGIIYIYGKVREQKNGRKRERREREKERKRQRRERKREKLRQKLHVYYGTSK